MSTNNDDDSKWGVVIGWLISAVIVAWISYSAGGSSKQPQIDAQNAQISTLQSQITSLKQSIPSQEPTTVYTPPVIQKPTQCPVTTCNDGSCSESTGRGTCSWHGGEAY